MYGPNCSNKVHVEYGINDQGNVDVRNTEYCGETCEIYFAKHPVCFSLHPEPCILYSSKDKL